MITEILQFSKWILGTHCIWLFKGQQQFFSTSYGRGFWQWKLIAEWGYWQTNHFSVRIPSVSLEASAGFTLTCALFSNFTCLSTQLIYKWQKYFNDAAATADADTAANDDDDDANHDVSGRYHDGSCANSFLTTSKWYVLDGWANTKSCNRKGTTALYI